jgi:hypothetical protein
MNSGKNITYTAEYIQLYLSGKMPNKEMHELEAAALEDTFLADAIDGYENKDNVDNDLAFLREKINNRDSKKSSTQIRKLYTSLSIAASLLIVFSIAYFLINNTDHKQQKLSSNDVKPKQNISPVLQETIPIKKLAIADSSSSFAKNDNNKNNNKSLEKNADEISFDFSAKEAQELASILKSEKPKTPSKIIERTEIQPNAKALTLVSATQQQLSTTAAIAKADDTKFGLDSKKETTAKLNQGSYNLVSTDSINSFSIVKNDEVAAVTVSKAKAGIPATANMSSNNDLQMQEVVVTGYNNTRKKVLNTSVQKISAKDLKNTERQTNTDKTAFDNYVKTHKTTCLDKAGNEIHGTVTLKFNVNKNGKPEKIKVEQSLDKACDEQAIKWLNEGPKWNGSLKKKEVVKITF